MLQASISVSQGVRPVNSRLYAGEETFMAPNCAMQKCVAPYLPKDHRRFLSTLRIRWINLPHSFSPHEPEPRLARDMRQHRYIPALHHTEAPPILLPGAFVRSGNANHGYTGSVSLARIPDNKTQIHKAAV
jgi:hypothetical protein